MQNLSYIIEELRLSQARCRGFESHHPLHNPRSSSKSAPFFFTCLTPEAYPLLLSEEL